MRGRRHSWFVRVTAARNARSSAGSGYAEGPVGFRNGPGHKSRRQSISLVFVEFSTWVLPRRGAVVPRNCHGRGSAGDTRSLSEYRKHDLPQTIPHDSRVIACSDNGHVSTSRSGNSLLCRLVGVIGRLRPRGHGNALPAT